MKAKQFLAVVLAGMMVFGTLTGCSSSKPEASSTTVTSEEKLDAEQYLNISLDAEPMILDSVRASDGYSATIMNEVFEPLTRLNEDENLKNFVEPAGAESWETSEDGLTWTFHLRDNKWSDGQPVKAGDYEYAIKRVLDPKNGAPYSFLLMPIKNAAKVNAGELPVEQLGVKAADDKTLVFTLETPSAYFINLTYQAAMLPQRQDIVEKSGEKYGTEIDTMVFNGPFVMTNWMHNSEINIEKNPNYWDANTVKMAKVNFKIIKEENAKYNSLQSGEIDALGVNKSEWVEKFSQNESLDKLTMGYPTTFYEFFNAQDKLLSNVNIRKALALGITREDMANVIFYGVNEPAYGWVPKTVMIGDKEYRTEVKEPLKTLAEENPDAKALFVKGLTELGMDPDPSKVTIKLLLGGTNQRFKTIGDYFQQMYKQTLGINVQPELVDWPIFMDKTSKYEFQMAYAAWGANFNDPICMLDLFKSNAESIYTNWSSQAYDDLINRASASLDQAERTKLFQEAENLLIYQDAVVAPVVYPRGNTFVYKYVKGLGVTNFGTVGFKYSYTEGREK